jgi:predicted RNA binding protein YcfA (HicA-like mRNA interferase family)
MSKLPIVSGAQLIRVLQRIGYYVRDQKGSHIHLRHPTRNPLTVPHHKEIARGTLRQILRDADLTVHDFVKLL